MALDYGNTVPFYMDRLQDIFYRAMTRKQRKRYWFEWHKLQKISTYSEDVVHKACLAQAVKRQ